MTATARTVVVAVVVAVVVVALPTLTLAHDDRVAVLPRHRVGIDEWDAEDPRVFTVDQRLSSTQAPSFTAALDYVHMWNDDSGETHISHCQLTNFTRTQLFPTVPPVFLENMADTTRIVFLETPPGPSGGFHMDPVPQWVILLHGSMVELRTSDNSTALIEPGMLVFGDDSFPKNKGHVTRNVLNDQPIRIAMTQFPIGSFAGKRRPGPCWLQ